MRSHILAGVQIVRLDDDWSSGRICLSWDGDVSIDWLEGTSSDGELWDMLSICCYQNTHKHPFTVKLFHVQIPLLCRSTRDNQFHQDTSKLHDEQMKLKSNMLISYLADIDTRLSRRHLEQVYIRWNKDSARRVAWWITPEFLDVTVIASQGLMRRHKFLWCFSPST